MQRHRFPNLTAEDTPFVLEVVLFVIVLAVFLASFAADGGQGSPVQATPTPPHAYRMACYEEPALPVPGGRLTVMRRTVEADWCTVLGGTASGGFTVHCYQVDNGQGWLYSAYLCVSFEQVR